MALRPIEIVTDGLLASGNSLSIAVRGLLRTSAVVVAAQKLIGYVMNVGQLMNR